MPVGCGTLNVPTQIQQKTPSTMSIDEFTFYQKKLEQYNYLVDYGNTNTPEAEALKTMLVKVGLL